jgi:osmoprotectant transport system ATP-binding protein
MKAIRIENVSRRFAGAARPAVDDVSIEVAAGEFVVLLGPSGSGKTTLLKMINRLFEASGGKIFVGDTEVHDVSANDLRRRIGYVIQQVGLFPHMTVAHNIEVVPRLLGWERSRRRARTDELLELVGLSPAADYRSRYPAELSGGEQQRVGVARALAADPDVLLMDEPFGAIDAITRTALQDEMLALQRRLQTTVLFVTHDVDEALRLADRIAVLDHGRLVQYGTPLDLLSHPATGFVRRLLGADDVMRRLRLLAVGTAMRPQPPYVDGQRDALTPETSLRDALATMLSSGATEMPVADGEGDERRVVGMLGVADIQALLHEEPSGEPSDGPSDQPSDQPSKESSDQPSGGPS